ncbi:MAG: anhydro-N-acetylmuramic acid kinase [Campylobacterota bacterium]|nr:anhydro-N-acetylmuramic acid kinase [Campylobacterota bacterium]
MSDQLYIGVMSGTSMDGIDIALCKIDSTKCELVYFEEYPFDANLKREILEIIQGSTTLTQVGTINKKLGLEFAYALTRFLREKELNAKDITAIGLHGQTLWHEPDAEFPFSMQLGDASTVYAKTGIKTIYDFRSLDVALGGQGAPFAPAFHQFLFKSLKKSAVLNIGGMANITLLEENLRGWDTGCGNVLLDMWISKCKNEKYDKDGSFAKSGEINRDLLNAMLNDEYFKKTPPKSTGREYFNEVWLANLLPIFNVISDEDIQRTLLELTAQSIANDVKKSDIELLILCGGGAKNSFLRARIEELSGTYVKTSDEIGIKGDALEAMAFAWLAYKRVHQKEVDLKSVTGATKNALLGAIYG